MSHEPSFPAEAFGTHDTPPASPPPPALSPLDPDPEEDRPVAAGGEASAVETVAAMADLKSKIWPAAGVAIGIGSAAVAAALLYRSRR